MSNPLVPRAFLWALALSFQAHAVAATPAAGTLDRAAEVLQVKAVQSLSVTGTGTWYQFGQAPAPGLPWPAFSLTQYAADIDYAAAAARVQITRRQIVEPGRVRPTPVDQRVDQYIVASSAWNVPVGTTNAAPAPQPAAVADRAAEIWSTPQGFVKAAQAHQATTRPAPGGTEVSFVVDGKLQYVGLIDRQGRVQRVRTWVDTPVLGDTLVETRFEDYRPQGGVPFPARIVRTQGGHPVLDLKVASVRINAAPKLAVPPSVASAAPAAVTVTATKIADGVHYLTGGTHHSVLIEQQDHLVLVEAPLNEQRSLALIAKARELAPGKPIRYLVNTHAHFDHSGGLRSFVDAGATIVTPRANRAFYERAWAASRKINPDRLATSGKPAKFETWVDRHVLTDGRRRIELHELAGNGHNDAFAVVYLPAEKLLVEADAYTPAATDAPPPNEPNPYSVNLYQNIVKLKLDVRQIAALHGPRLVALDDLRSAIGQQVLHTTAQR